jgi:hypothetical protein
MTSFDRRLMTLANLLVGGTGVAYGIFRYFIKPDDPLALAHPGQPVAQYAHILSAPLLVFAIGHMFYHHAILTWRAGARAGRRSGVSMLALAWPMILSGYLLQTTTGEIWRFVWIAAHVSTSALWIAAYIAHLISHARRRA